MKKPAFCICQNKGADQLWGNGPADQHLYFRYIDFTVPLLHKSKISSLLPSSVVVQAGMCQTWSKIPQNRFSHDVAHMVCDSKDLLSLFYYVFAVLHYGVLFAIALAAFF